VDIVLGVSIAPETVRMVLVEGVNADGVTLDEDNFDVVAGDGSATPAAADQAIVAIQGTRESAAEGGYRLTSTGVTWTAPAQAAALRDALGSDVVGPIMLVSPLLAAAALAQTVGAALGYANTALLFVEADSATLAAVNTSDGSIVDLHRRLVHSPQATAELAEMVAGLDALESHPDGVFVVGCGVDIVAIKPQLEGATSLPVNAPEEPDMALARGAALASANAPLFASSTAALAYAQDPGTGELGPYAVAPVYLDVSGNANFGSAALAYGAMPEEGHKERSRLPGPLVLAGSAFAAALVIGVVALVISLLADVRPTVGQRPHPGGSVATPAKQAPPPEAKLPAVPPAPSAPAAAPPPAAPTPPPAAPAVPPAAPAPPAAAPAPPPETIPVPAPVVAPRLPATPNPALETPIRQVPRRAPAYVPPPAPAPAAPAPAEEPAPAAPPPPSPAAPPPPPAAPPAPPAAPPPPPALPPMTMYLHLPFVTVPISLNPPPAAPPPPGP
jgi:hypothetical protein